MNIGNEVRAIKEKLNELWKLVISMRASGGGGGGTHNLLSNTHPDTTTAAAQRGDIIYSDAAGSWKRLAKGTANQVLQGDGTDTKWGAVPAHKTQHQAGGSDVVDADTVDGSHAADIVSAAATPDADATTKGKVQLAGQLSGTAASPTVVGLKESGGQALAMGAVADGKYLKRSGTSIVGDTPAGSGGASIIEIQVFGG